MVKITRRFDGVSKEVMKILEADMDEAPARCRAREAFMEHQLSVDHYLFKLPLEGMKTNEIDLEATNITKSGSSEEKRKVERHLNQIEPITNYRKIIDMINVNVSVAFLQRPVKDNPEESYEFNSRGLKIFTKSWLPKTSLPKAVICYCHGYGDTCTFFGEGIARKLVLSGYGVFALDYPGFGLSEGLHGYIPNFDILVDDVIEQYSKIKDNSEFSDLPRYLMGQSMGGAVALKVHLKQPKAWSGAILVAPMCKIADDMVPPRLVTQLLMGIAKVLPKHKLVPLKDLAEMAFRDLKKREMAAYNVIAYRHKPRLQTAVELMKTTEEIEHRLEEVSLPLLVLHGEDDKVTDPSISKELYEKASSLDKNFNLYKDAYHCLLEGEPDEMIDRVFTDIISWLDERCVKF